MIDSFKRHITSLRLSVTDRCNLRCVYCMGEGMRFLPREQVLSFLELERLCAAFVRMGVRRIRLTGGEPLVRRDVMTLIEALGDWVRQGRLDELTLTTNGTRLAGFAPSLAAAGIRRINVSLDTLDPHRFAQLSRHGRLDDVLDGLRAAKAAGLQVRVNAVARRDMSGKEADDLILFCGAHGFDLCFIELMPLGENRDDDHRLHLPIEALRASLSRRWNLVDNTYRTSGPARYCTVIETGRRIGLISASHRAFCSECDRVRLSCSGMLYPCLGSDQGHDLRAVLRGGADEAEMERAIAAAITLKPRHHTFGQECNEEGAPLRSISVTGG